MFYDFVGFLVRFFVGCFYGYFFIINVNLRVYRMGKKRRYFLIYY